MSKGNINISSNINTTLNNTTANTGSITNTVKTLSILAATFHIFIIIFSLVIIVYIIKLINDENKRYNLSAKEKKVLNALKIKALTFKSLINETKLNEQELLGALIKLETKAFIKKDGDSYKLVKKLEDEKHESSSSN